MDDILLFNINGDPIKYYYQWDSEQSVMFKGVNAGLETDVHFCNIDSEKSFVVSPTVSGDSLTAKVPNKLLQCAKPVIIYLYKIDDTTGNNTIYSARITVVPRPKPADYVYTETEILKYSQLDERIKALEDGGVPNGVKSVNGITPDENGNVEIAVSGNSAKTSCHISYNLVNTVSDNYISTVNKGDSFAVSVTAIDGHALTSCKIIHAGETVMDESYDTTVIGAEWSVNKNMVGTGGVQGDIAIIAVAEPMTEPNVFVGDDTTTIVEYYEAFSSGKVCFMKRFGAGGAQRTWILDYCTKSLAHFYHINTATGWTEYGSLTGDGTWTSEIVESEAVDLTGYATEKWVHDGYQPKGDYALRSEVPTKVSQLQNDEGYLTEHQDISGKLDADKLPEAIDEALAQAKASGEFKGEAGPKGDQGIQGEQGEPGSSGVWIGSDNPVDNDYTVWIDPDGEADDVDMSEQIMVVVDDALAQAKQSGEFDGKDGYTPVRGTDYWTDADKAEIKSYVDEAILGGAW